MKSAKETLAQYRSQGFSDEMIELIAMEEENQELAEALIEALISETEDSNSKQETLDFEDSPEISDSETDDIMESEELIKSAYERIGMHEDDDSFSEDEYSEEISEEYIPPKLEVIEGGAMDEDETIISFIPDYALSEEEQEIALARSEFFFGTTELEGEITPHYTDEDRIDISKNEDWYVDEVEVVDVDDYELAEEYDTVEVLEVDTDTENCIDIADYFDCFDFDSIGRGTVHEAKVIDFAEAILDLDNSRPAEKEWSQQKTTAQHELEEIRSWAEGVEIDIIHTHELKKQLEKELSNRDDTIVVQSREMDQLNTIHAGYLEQLANESRMLAAAESKLNDMREEAGRSDQMLLKFGDEIELLHGQLFTANSICSSQSSEILEKNATIQSLSNSYSQLLKTQEREASARNEELRHKEEAIQSQKSEILEKDAAISELSEACRKLQQENRTDAATAEERETELIAEQKKSDATIQVLQRRIAELDSQLAHAATTRSSQTGEYIAQQELINSLSSELSNTMYQSSETAARTEELEALCAKQQRRIRRLEKVREKIKKLEFENNVYRTETVPNLQADKEDLVQLASKEYNKAKELDEIAARRSRRLSYSTTLAAAACLMLVLMPVLSWNNIETEKDSIKSQYSMQLASAEADNLKLEDNLAVMQDELNELRNEYSEAKENWSIQLSNLKLENAKSRQSSEIIQASAESSISQSDLDLVAFEEDILTDTLATQAEFEREGQYNAVAGLDEFKNSFAAAEPQRQNLEMIEGKTAQVRKGEGLSQVLWRVYRRSNPEMVSYISNLNNLKKDRRGNPLLKVDQKLVLPKDVNTAMANSSELTPQM